MDHVTFGMGPLMVSYQRAKFVGHEHCGSGHITVLVRHVILQEHVIKGSVNFMGRSPSR